jgi:protein TonB
VKNDKRSIIGYLKGDRKGRAANRVERAAMQDAFLAEALAGYEQHAGDHVRTIVKLERQVKAHVPLYRRFYAWWETLSGDINITGSEWLELVFEGKNQAYGAYALRRYSSRRHLLAYVYTIGFAVLILLFPSALLLFTPDRSRDEMLAVTTLSSMSEVPEENKIEKIEAPPPPPLRSTIKFTIVKIVEDEKVRDEEVHTMEELTEMKAAISVADVQGNDDDTGQDIADLEAHKLIVETEPVYMTGAVEQNPEFPGGMAALNKWIKNELRYPASAAEMGIAGRVTVQFTVGKDGAVRDIIILRGVDSSIDKEALRIVGKMPEWIPGKQGGQAVNVRFILPITFQLQQ